MIAIKFRLYLKRLSGPIEQNPKMGSLGRYDIQALASSFQISLQTLAALHAELLGRLISGLGLPTIDHPALLQVSLQGTKYNLDDPDVAYGLNFPPNISKQFTQQLPTEDIPSVGAWPPKNICVVPSVNLTGPGAQNSNMLTTVMQHHQQRQLVEQQQKLSASPESCRPINVQPSCLVAPSQSAANFHAANSLASISQASNFSKSNVIDTRILTPLSGNSSSGSIGNRNATGSLSPSDNSGSWQVQNPACVIGASRHLAGIVPTIGTPDPANQKSSGLLLDQGSSMNLGHASRASSIPSRFAVDESESQISNMHHSRIYNESNTRTVKQEPDMSVVGNAEVSVQMLQRTPRNDFMSVLH